MRGSATDVLQLNVGTDLSLSDLRRFLELNEKYPRVRIASVFGSLREETLGLKSARPDFRIADTDRKTFERFVREAAEHGIETEYAANAALCQPIGELREQEGLLKERFRYLESVGVKRVIAANPLLMEWIGECSGLKIKVSTILGVNRPSAIRHYAALGADNLCPDIYINRDLPLLKELQTEGDACGVAIELLANEICFFGDTPCSGMLRDACYQHSSMGGNPDGAFGGWPFSRCQEERRKHPECWLKIPYILPQHLRDYARLTGVTRFKISGRTNSRDYLFTTVERYMAEQFSGDVAELFMLPQNVRPMGAGRFDCEKLIRLGHFKKWINETGEKCGYDCASCGHCRMIYGKL